MTFQTLSTYIPKVEGNLSSMARQELGETGEIIIAKEFS